MTVRGATELIVNLIISVVIDIFRGEIYCIR